MTTRGRALIAAGVVGTVVLAFLGFAFLVRDGDDESGAEPVEVGGSAPDETYEITVDRCLADDSPDQPRLLGTITNTTDAVQSYTIDVEFRWDDQPSSPFNGGTRVIDLPPGETTGWNATGGGRTTWGGGECALIAVDSWDPVYGD